MLSLLNSLRKQKKKVYYVYDQPLILYLNNLQFALFQGFIFSMQFNIYELVARIGFLIIISKGAVIIYDRGGGRRENGWVKEKFEVL